MYGATIVCLFCLLLLKVMQEALVTSSPIVMNVFFAWDSADVGIVFCFLGFLVIPMNMVIAHIRQNVSD